MNKLSDKRQAFCREYMIDHNATQAAIRAGYSRKSAQAQGSRLLSNAMVKQRIAEQQAKAVTRNSLDVDQVIQMLLDDRAEAGDLKQMGPKVRAGELIGRTIGAFVDKVDTVHIKTPDQVLDQLDWCGPIAKGIVRHIMEGLPASDEAILRLVNSLLADGAQQREQGGDRRPVSPTSRATH